MTRPTPTSAARPMQGLADWLRAKANTAFALSNREEANRFSGWASEVEAVQAQPASAHMGEPLSDKQINELWLFRSDLHNGEILPQVRDLARAIEAAHGISGESSRATNGVPATGETVYGTRNEGGPHG